MPIPLTPLSSYKQSGWRTGSIVLYQQNETSYDKNNYQRTLQPPTLRDFYPQSTVKGQFITNE